MNQRPIKWLIVAMALALGLLGSCNLALAEEKTTNASVEFTYGQLEWKDPGFGEGDGMNLDFDEHDTPTHYVEYNSIKGPHLLRISDAREPGSTTKWSVTVKLSEFEMTTDDSETFDATITLENPSRVLGQDELIKEENISVSSGGVPQPVLEATAELGRGTFDTSWLDADTMLIIQPSEAVKIKAGAYKAILTWSLEIVP